MTETEFRKHVMPLQRLMYGIALRMGIPPDEAGDTVQESLLRLWRHRNRIPSPDAGLKVYCIAAHRNECISWLKHSRYDAPIEEASNISAPLSEDAEFRDTSSRLSELIDALPAGQREVIRLSGIGGLDNNEIAELTGQTDNNVRQLLSRGRRKLRVLLETRF
ncbi:MAG: sigma-70 family RNA polymerase sigma factor [Muribaculaceae bacterium]|nr:sigma-70 family RNA polymerase sigma factor [Muribaculaceae bacterium]